MTLKRHANVEGKLTCGLKNDLRKLANFHQSTYSVKNGTLMGFFCTKQKRYNLKICRGVMCHDNEE